MPLGGGGAPRPGPEVSGPREVKGLYAPVVGHLEPFLEERRRRTASASVSLPVPQDQTPGLGAAIDPAAERVRIFLYGTQIDEACLPAGAVRMNRLVTPLELLVAPTHQGGRSNIAAPAELGSMAAGGSGEQLLAPVEGASCEASASSAYASAPCVWIPSASVLPTGLHLSEAQRLPPDCPPGVAGGVWEGVECFLRLCASPCQHRVWASCRLCQPAGANGSAWQQRVGARRQPPDPLAQHPHRSRGWRPAVEGQTEERG